VIIIDKAIAGVRASALAAFLRRAQRAAKLAGDVNVLVTKSRQMQRLNRRFRGKDKPTDVLSFPANGLPEGRVAGDIAISAEIARDNARRRGHSLTEEIQILILHGVLHLAGYDHEQDDGRMALNEARLRKSLALPVGLIERCDSTLFTTKDTKVTKKIKKSRRKLPRTRGARANR